MTLYLINLIIFGLARQLSLYNWWTTCNITASMQIYFITSRQVLYTIGINPNIYRQIPQIYHGNYSGGNYLLTNLFTCNISIVYYINSTLSMILWYTKIVSSVTLLLWWPVIQLSNTTSHYLITVTILGKYI